MDLFTRITKTDAPIAFNYFHGSIAFGGFLFGVLFGWNGIIVLGILYLVVEHLRGKANVRNGNGSRDLPTVNP